MVPREMITTAEVLRGLTPPVDKTMDSVALANRLPNTADTIASGGSHPHNRPLVPYTLVNY